MDPFGTSDTLREGARLPRAIIAGFVATVAMTITLLVAYFIAWQLGDPEPPAYATFSGPPQWMWALTHNRLTDLARGALPIAFGIHLAMGLFWALVYAYVVEPRLQLSDGLRGLVFSLIPWVLSLVVFLPVAGGGFLGLSLGAGPLPVLGNFVLHVVYGVALGELYGRLGSGVLTDTGLVEAPEERAALARAERAAAAGIVTGAVLGALLGLVAGGVFGDPLGAPLPASTSGIVLGLFWALLGGAVGALVGSLVGLESHERRRES